MFIEYDGTNAGQIRAAIGSLKPGSRIEAVFDLGGLRFDQVWPDGQVSEGRWRIREGQYLNADTGAVVDQP